MATHAGQTEIAKRYAMAFFELADETGVIDAVADDLAALSGMLDKSADLERLISNPLLSRKDQNRALQAVAAAAGFNDLTRKFLGVLADNRRLSMLAQIIHALRDEVSRSRGEVTAEVTTATPLDEKQITALTDALKGALGAKVSLDAKTDPDMLGGLIVRVGSKMIDNSVRTKLDRLHRQLKSGTDLQFSEHTNVKEVA